MTADVLKLNNVCIEKAVLDVPPLEDIAQAFNSKLGENFRDFFVEVVDCPDLTQEPFNLAAKGFGGNPSILDVGGPAFLLPTPKREKVYDLRDIPEVVGDTQSFIIGAGAGPWPYVGVNCEMICNAVVTPDKVVVPSTRLAKVVDEGIGLKVTPANESRYCVLANLFSCRGEPGKVVKVRCSNRIGPKDFIATLRTALESCFPDKIIGMAGVAVILKGKAKFHVMPDFSKEPINNDDELNQWLKFFELNAPLTTVGTFVSKDPGLDLRVQHFHGFGKTVGGHYHYDTTPETVEYLAYLAAGSVLYRVDKPPVFAGFGSD